MPRKKTISSGLYYAVMISPCRRAYGADLPIGPLYFGRAIPYYCAGINKTIRKEKPWAH